MPLKLTPYVEYDKDAATQFPRATVKQVYDQVVSDLLMAGTLLTESPQKTKGMLHRASWQAADLLLNRVYLYMQNWEEAEKKAKEAERERIINEAIKKRLDKAERVKTAQYYEKFMDPDNEQENDKPEENNAELNPQAVEFKPVTVGPSNNAVQDDVDIFDSEESIDTDEVEANVQADADTELFEDGTDTDIQAPQIDDVVFDDETEVLDVDEDLDDLSVDIQDTQSAQPAKQGRGQVVNSDDDVSLDDVDLFDDTTVSRTEERPQNVKTSGKTMGSQKQPQTTQNNSDIDYMSLNDISIFDSEE